MTNQGDFTAGGILQASDLNSFGVCTILRDTFTVNNNVSGGQNVTFTTELIDVGGWHSTTTDTHLITVTYAGVYLVTANARTINSSNRGLINVVLTGGGLSSSTVASTDDNQGAFDLSCAVHVVMVAGQSVYMNMFQNSGASVTPECTLGVHLIRRTS